MSELNWPAEIELESGVKVTYWVAQSMTVDLKSLKAHVNCEGYLDESAFADKPPIVTGIYYTIDVSPLGQDGALVGAVLDMVKAAQQASMQNGG